MKQVFIKHRKPGIINGNYEYMPNFMYAMPLDVVNEDDETITVQKGSENYRYIFRKEYIEKRLD